MPVTAEFTSQLKGYQRANAVTVYGKRPIEQALNVRVKLGDQILDPRIRRNVFPVLAPWQLCFDQFDPVWQRLTRAIKTGGPATGMWKAQQAHSRISISGAASQPGISRHVL